ncbi:hypothetical protein BGZ65_000448, partial [Modicella reniformis]
LFDTNLAMRPHQHQQQHQQQVQAQQVQQQQYAFRERGFSASSIHSPLSPSSPAMNLGQGNETSPGAATNPNPVPTVITTMNEEGREVGFYFAVPQVNLNPGASDADLFRDFEDFVWVENHFDVNTTGVGEVTAGTMTATLGSSSAISRTNEMMNTFSISTAIPMTGNNQFTQHLQG